MKRGKKPTPSVSFYMRSSEYGDVKMLFSYNGERYSGGTTYISLMVDAFDLLKPNGEPKDAANVNNPRMANGVLVSDLLVYMRRRVIEGVESRLSAGGTVDEAYVKELCSDVSRGVFERLHGSFNIEGDEWQ